MITGCLPSDGISLALTFQDFQEKKVLGWLEHLTLSIDQRGLGGTSTRWARPPGSVTWGSPLQPADVVATDHSWLLGGDQLV